MLSINSYRTSLILLAILCLAFIVRLYGITTLPYNYDEPRNIKIINSINLKELNLPLHSFQHPPLSVYMHKIGTLLFGRNNFGYRFMNVLIGSLSALLIYFLAKSGFKSEMIGIISALFLATNRFHIGWSRHINQEIIYLALIIFSILIFWKIYEKGSGWLLLCAAISFSILAKEMAFLIIFPLILFLLTDEKGRNIFRRKNFYIFLFSTILFGLLIFIYSYLHPAKDELNLSKNLERLFTIGLSSESVEFFLMPLNQHDYLPLTWQYPYMFWGTGVILLFGICYSFPMQNNNFIRFMLILFSFYFLLFTFIGAMPPVYIKDFPFHGGEFWWSDVTLIPAIILTSNMLISLRRKYNVFQKIFVTILVYLVVNSVFFTSVTHNGPIIKYFGLTYSNITKNAPFLF
ncbi:MAG: ArnT family glycosyltransferase [Candidatus Hodarchaeales archaeon]|jgi:4-amino-4-deoxy-L-arabinose transferase-like glycosyltransferase